MKQTFKLIEIFAEALVETIENYKSDISDLQTQNNKLSVKINDIETMEGIKIMNTTQQDLINKIIKPECGEE